MEVLNGVVTGASSGLGEEFARQLAARNINLVICARRIDRLELLKTELCNKYKIKVVVVGLDLTESKSASQLFENSTREFGKIHFLINNAGVGYTGGFLSFSPEQQREMTELNVGALTHLSALFSKHMLEHGERSYIANIGSIAGYQANPQFSVYAATKAFVRSFSESLAAEFSRTNISVTHIAPGAVNTEFLDNSKDTMSQLEKDKLPLAREVVREGIAALLSGKSSQVVGGKNKVRASILRAAPSSLLVKHFSRNL